MKDYLLILVSTVLANNFVLARFLGLCPFMGVSNKLEGAIGMSVVTMFVLTLSSASSYLVFHYLLQPYSLEYLSTLSFILVIAVTVQLAELIMRKTNPVLFRILHIFLPLIASNCVVLGVALLNAQQQHNFVQSALYGFGAATGFGLVLVMFAAMRERIAFADVPEPFRGSPIGLITAGLMALAFMGFTGLARL
ncbi:MAG: electron transport complex subunit RsxA [Xanthomonadales bacterium]|nr:electron transport complex subunit RsxA [Xanthomonadales bacterium]